MTSCCLFRRWQNFLVSSLNSFFLVELLLAFFVSLLCIQFSQFSACQPLFLLRCFFSAYLPCSDPYLGVYLGSVGARLCRSLLFWVPRLHIVGPHQKVTTPPVSHVQFMLFILFLFNHAFMVCFIVHSIGLPFKGVSRRHHMEVELGTWPPLSGLQTHYSLWTNFHSWSHEHIILLHLFFFFYMGLINACL